MLTQITYPKENTHQTNDKTQIEGIKALVMGELEAVDAILKSSLDASVPLIHEVYEHIYSSGGKRLRPLVVILIALAYGYQGMAHHQAAAIVEFIHTATLLHDDVVDASTLRRGKETANQRWGNEISILVGDFIYSRTFQLITKMSHPEVMEILAKSTSLMAEGEVKQLINRCNPDIDESDYLQIITYKTAKLFEVAAILGAVVAEVDASCKDAIGQYGMNLGLAFQLIDDALDYYGDVTEIGKKLGDDLAEGKPTLPLIYAMKHGPFEQAQVIRHAIQNGGSEDLSAILKAVEQSQALHYVTRLATSYAEKARDYLESIPGSPYKTALYDLTEFVVHRSH